MKREVLIVETNDVGRDEGTEVMLRQYHDPLEGAKKAGKEVAVASM